MERWYGKTAVVTGASSGIGLATAKSLVGHGLVVIGLDRRSEKMKDEMKNINGPGEFYAKECDVTNEESVAEIFNWIKDKFKSLDILVNNASIMNFKKMIDSPTPDLEAVFKVNVFGLLYCTKQAIKLMKEKGTEAHIINMNSVVGHRVEPTVAEMSTNVYPATKFAITALSETFRNELSDTKIPIFKGKIVKSIFLCGIQSISPGPVRTEMFDTAAEIVPRLKSKPALRPEDVTNSIVYALSVPAHVEINEIM